MNSETATRSTDNAFCLSCGYPLRELPACRCPECGRAFDPANPRTMTLGHPLRAWQRWLLRPTGWRVISLAILGTAALAYLSRWPRLSPEPPSVLLDEFHWPRPYTMPPTAPDVVFYAAVVLWASFIAWTLFWQLARVFLVPRAGRRANIWGIDTRGRHRVIVVAAAVSVLCMIFGWQTRVGQRWMARAMAPVPANSRYGNPYNPRYDPWRRSPVALSPEQARKALSAFIVDLPSAGERLHALGLLVETAGRAALPAILRAERAEQDATVLVWELRLTGLCRDPATAPLLIDRLQDPRSEVRAAAADAVGILRHPSYSIYVPDGFWVSAPLALDTQPPAYIGGIVSTPSSRGLSFNGGFAEHDLLNDPPVAIDPAVRETLERLMVTGATAVEREAAARTLVDWPPDHYRLRIAEWGVWTSSGGQLAFAKTLLDEVPPFVHSTGDPTKSFDSYFLYPSIIKKPIVHLTSDRALALDLESQISEGRPWFGFPMPDDYAIGGEEVSYRPIGAVGKLPAHLFAGQASAEFTDPSVPSLPDCREGYPWLVPHHRVRRSGTAGFGPPLIACLGLRWQSLIISPHRLSCMAAPPVPSDPRFWWWKRLREVPSDWVASRGETERFLYYDGPTRSAVPLAVTLEDSGRQLRFTTPPTQNSHYLVRPQREPHFQAMNTSAPPGLPEHEGMYIEVRSGQVRAAAIQIEEDDSVPLHLDPALTGESAVAGRLREMLVRYGLTGPEADGLIAAWAPQFFRTEGRRFILRMSPAEYARQCPMQVRPAPTEVVRLGLVLTEFDPIPTATIHPAER